MTNLIKKANHKILNPEATEIMLEAQSQKVSALFINCTLKASNYESNTRALIDKVIGLMDDYNVESEVITPADYNIAWGVSVEKENDDDEFPEIYKKMKKADIIVFATPIWFGVRGSILQLIIERLIGSYSDSDDQGRWAMYGKVGGVIVTGNEDGAHDVVANTNGNLAHLGFVVPPNNDCYWVGDAGAGPSYIQAGKKHLYTNKSAEFMSHNLPFYSRLIKANPNPINIGDLKDKAKKISDEPVEYASHKDQEKQHEKDSKKPTDRERQENDQS